MFPDAVISEEIRADIRPDDHECERYDDRRRHQKAYFPGKRFRFGFFRPEFFKDGLKRRSENMAAVERQGRDAVEKTDIEIHPADPEEEIRDGENACTEERCIA